MGGTDRIARQAAPLLWAVMVLAGCSSPGGPAPIVDDPIGAGMTSLGVEGGVANDAAAQELLAEYSKRFKHGYPLYAGDKIRFVVLGNAELSFSAPVPAEGYLNFPHIGKLDLAGRTLDDIRVELTRRLGDGYLNKPDVTVLVEEYSKKFVYVFGAVNQPKDYEIPSGRMITLLQAVSQAFGFQADAEKRSVLIIRPRQIGGVDRVTIPVDVVALMRTGRGSDPLLLPEDVVFVPEREKIYVSGQVIKGGEYATTSDYPTTITKAISMAGGFTRIAKESAVRLNRRLKDGRRETYVVDVAAILDGHPELDVPLQPGDVIFVPQSFF